MPIKFLLYNSYYIAQNSVKSFFWYFNGSVSILPCCLLSLKWKGRFSTIRRVGPLNLSPSQSLPLCLWARHFSNNTSYKCYSILGGGWRCRLAQICYWPPQGNCVYATVLFSLTCSVSYTILSVKQERILEELDDEAKIQIIRGPRTGANSW